MNSNLPRLYYNFICNTIPSFDLEVYFSPSESNYDSFVCLQEQTKSLNSLRTQ